eukprot:5528196-Alexandrium_andersonii.AAC.1
MDHSPPLAARLHLQLVAEAGPAIAWAAAAAPPVWRSGPGPLPLHSRSIRSDASRPGRAAAAEDVR